jgi:hypothetical protein
MANIITLRTIYKIKEYHFQPMKQANGSNYPFVKPVRYDAFGNTEMILTDTERNSPESAYFIPEDLDIVVTEGTTFNLDNPLDRNKWDAIKNSDLIAPSRFAKDSHGDSLIDGNKFRYGRAEILIDVPGEESAQSVNKKKLITKAWSYIENDTLNGHLTKCKLLGKPMMNAPATDVMDYLYQFAETDPSRIIDLYTSTDSSLMLLMIDAKERNVIRKVNGLWMYGENVLGATDDAILLYMKTPQNKIIYDALRDETYPEYVKKAEVVKLDIETAEETAAPVVKTTKSKK